MENDIEALRKLIEDTLTQQQKYTEQEKYKHVQQKVQQQMQIDLNQDMGNIYTHILKQRTQQQMEDMDIKLTDKELDVVEIYEKYTADIKKYEKREREALEFKGKHMEKFTYLHDKINGWVQKTKKAIEEKEHLN